MVITISIIEFIAIGILALKLYQKNVTIKSLRESLDSKREVFRDNIKSAVSTPISDSELVKENAELKEKIERYHEEASRLNRKIYSLKQELKSKESNDLS
jgi:predicted Holliday junction resolvase-like endonuclease